MDSRVELRDAGRRPVVLATDAALNRDLGLSRGLPVGPMPSPDPVGSEVAVEVWPSAGGNATWCVSASGGGS